MQHSDQIRPKLELVGRPFRMCGGRVARTPSITTLQSGGSVMLWGWTRTPRIRAGNDGGLHQPNTYITCLSISWIQTLNVTFTNTDFTPVSAEVEIVFFNLLSKSLIVK